MSSEFVDPELRWHDTSDNLPAPVPPEESDDETGNDIDEYGGVPRTRYAPFY